MGASFCDPKIHTDQPAEYYAKVGAVKLAAGWSVWIFGSQNDAPIGAEIRHRLGDGCIDLTGRTTLAQAVDLMSLTHTVVTNDSGLLHVAAALGKRLVALYGSSDPSFTPPLTDRATILSLGLACSPCFRRQCPLGHLRCLQIRQVRMPHRFPDLASSPVLSLVGDDVYNTRDFEGSQKTCCSAAA